MKTILLAGAALALVAAFPAWAGHSSRAQMRAEIEITRQLNLEASHASAPHSPVAPPRAASTPEDALAMNAPPSAAPTSRVETAATLSTISNPPRKIATANVLDSRGQIVGAVQRVEVTPQGHPTRVAVALLGEQEQLIVLDASTVSYDAATNQIMAQTTADQLKAMPGKS